MRGTPHEREFQRFQPRADASQFHWRQRRSANLPWGQGDTPLIELLKLVQRKRYPIPCIIEYEYKGEQAPVAEVQRCVDYIRHALA